MTTRAPLLRHANAIFSTLCPRATSRLSSSLRYRNTLPAACPTRAFSSSNLLQLKKYSEDHEWVELEGKTATVGISKYAAKSLGDVVYVEVPEVGGTVEAGNTMGAVESVKAASDIISPISGSVVETNNELESTPKLINEDPEGKGWIAKIEAGENLEKELEELMDDTAYKAFTEDN